MALGPIGNVIYTNQQIPYVASLKTDHIQRIDFQNMMAGHLTNEKEKEVEEVRPAEENKEIDPDREHQRETADEETQNKNKKEQKKSETKSSLHKLDIRV